MKKNFLTLAVALTTGLLVGCTSTGQSFLSGLASNAVQQGTTSTTTSQSSTTGSAISSLLGSLLGSFNTLDQNDILGTWRYTGPDCVFETENFLMKAGGELAAAKIENQLSGALAKVGISSGKCSFTFNQDNTYTAVIGGRAISGTYTLDAENKTITMTYLQGLGTMTPKVALVGNKLSLLFDADKLLKTVGTVAALSGKSSLTTLSNLVNSYDGMLIGMELQK